MNERVSVDSPTESEAVTAGRPVGASAIGCLSLLGSAMGLGSAFWMASDVDLTARLAELSLLAHRVS